ncbi:hypothetical protein [Kineococcus rhizosphaerae]|uniref:Uncharacterized protein n=1 Tax=Kineococcus rhizosphaerae TaxID=559628 RepID=A0A2T0R2S6_9ACTN|nr:hypothetical protein [Kineococcus rhizosphaerae]PRY14071.1 hypothetical protein CLV37_107190 [Kineococcus rhizosphaerae]
MPPTVHLTVVTVAAWTEWQRYPQTLRHRVRARLTEQADRRGLHLDGAPSLRVEGVGDQVRVRITATATAAPAAVVVVDGGATVVGLGDPATHLAACLERAELAGQRAGRLNARLWVTSVRGAGLRQRTQLSRLQSTATRLGVPELVSAQVPPGPPPGTRGWGR